MALSSLATKGNSSVSPQNTQNLRITFDTNLRRWFGRNLGTWFSRRQYFFGEEEVVHLDMFIKVEKVNEINAQFEKYRFSWWCEKDYEFFKEKATYKKEGVIEATLQGHQLIRNNSYLSSEAGISSIRQVDEHELIFESHYKNWDILEHTRLIDQDKYRSRVIYSWKDKELNIVENHHETKIISPMPIMKPKSE